MPVQLVWACWCWWTPVSVRRNFAPWTAATLTSAAGGRAGERARGKGAHVYLGARTRRELAKYWRAEGEPASNRPVWVNLNTGGRLTESGLRQMLARLGELAGVQHCHPHTFRRTFALWSLRGMNIHVLAADGP